MGETPISVVIHEMLSGRLVKIDDDDNDGRWIEHYQLDGGIFGIVSKSSIYGTHPYYYVEVANVRWTNEHRDMYRLRILTDIETARTALIEAMAIRLRDMHTDVTVIETNDAGVVSRSVTVA